MQFTIPSNKQKTVVLWIQSLNEGDEQNECIVHSLHQLISVREKLHLCYNYLNLSCSTDINFVLTYIIYQENNTIDILLDNFALLTAVVRKAAHSIILRRTLIFTSQGRTGVTTLVRVQSPLNRQNSSLISVLYVGNHLRPWRTHGRVREAYRINTGRD